MEHFLSNAIHAAMDKNDYSTAIFLSERLVEHMKATTPSSSSSVAPCFPNVHSSAYSDVPIPLSIVDHAAVLLLATCFYRIGKLKRCYAVLKGCTTNYDSVYLFSLCCVQLGNYHEAEAALLGSDKSIQLLLAPPPAPAPSSSPSSLTLSVPGGAHGYHLLGRICQLTGRGKIAILFFKKALQTDSCLWSAFESLCQMDADVSPSIMFTPESIQAYINDASYTHNNNKLGHMSLSTPAIAKRTASVSVVTPATPVSSTLGTSCSLGAAKSTDDGSFATPVSPRASNRTTAAGAAAAGGGGIRGHSRSTSLSSSSSSSTFTPSVDAAFLASQRKTLKSSAFKFAGAGASSTTTTPVAKKLSSLTTKDTETEEKADKASSDKSNRKYVSTTPTHKPRRSSRLGVDRSVSNDDISVSSASPALAAAHTAHGMPALMSSHDQKRFKRTHSRTTSALTGAPAAGVATPGTLLLSSPSAATTPLPVDAIMGGMEANAPARATRARSNTDPTLPSPVVYKVEDGELERDEEGIITAKNTTTGNYSPFSVFAVKKATTETPLPQPTVVAPLQFHHKHQHQHQQQGSAIDAVSPFAIANILSTLQPFAQGLRLQSQFKCKEAVEALQGVPNSHYFTGWTLAIVGRCYFEMGEYLKAVNAYQLLRKVDPYRIQGLEYYSTALWHLKKEVELSYLAQQAVDIDRMAPETWIIVGNCFSLQKEHDTALKFFKRATKLDPQCAYAYTLCGHEHVANEDFDKAVMAYRRAISVDGRHYNAWYGMGNIYFRQEKFDMASVHFSRASEINIRSSVLFCYRGMVMHANKRYQEAMFLLDEADRLQPKNPLTKFQKANVYLSQGLHEQALKELYLVQDIAPKEASVHFLMGKIYKKMNRLDEALMRFVKALDLDPKDRNLVKTAIDTLYGPLNANDEDDNSEDDFGV